MRRLILLRHAKAAREAGGGDRQRPLTRRGREDAMRVGHYLVDQHLAPNLAVVSDARRTRETLDCVLSAAGRSCKSVIDPALYLAEDFVLLGELHKAPDVVQTLLTIGHNPGLAEFAFRIAGSGDREALARLDAKYPTAGMAIIEFGDTPWPEIEWGGGRLDRFITPSMLADEAEDTD